MNIESQPQENAQREEVRREQQQEGQRRRGHAQHDADPEEHAQQREQVRGLADEQVVQGHVGHDQGSSRSRR